MSSALAPPARMAGRHPLPIGTHVQSPSGRSYLLEKVLYERKWSDKFVFRLYCATYDGKRFILKDIIPGDFEYTVSLQKLVHDSPHVRTFVDSIPDRNILVYPYRETSLLLVDVKSMPDPVKRRVIRDALAGLADLHDKGIYHSDIKPPNVVMDSVLQEDGTVDIRNVQITDLENGVVLPAGSPGITDRLSGSAFWRSPEAWARAVQNTPSDVFSFGIMAVYIWLGQMVFYSKEASDPDCPLDMQAALVLRHHVSYFGDRDGGDDFRGFVQYHGGGESQFIQGIRHLLDDFREEDPRLPWQEVTNVDPVFKDFIGRMTCLDPRRRIAAREALQHPWLAE